MQNTRTSVVAMITNISTKAITIGPEETWKAEKVSIWQVGICDNPFGQCLTVPIIGKKIMDFVVPMSLLSYYPNVQFNPACS